MSKNNRANRKRREHARHAELKRNRLRDRIRTAKIDRDPRSIHLQNSMLAAIKEYVAEGKTIEEARAAVFSELAEMQVADRANVPGEREEGLALLQQLTAKP